MFERKNFPILLVISFVAALGLSLFLLKPSVEQFPNQDAASVQPVSQPSNSHEIRNKEPINEPILKVEQQAKTEIKIPTLSAALQVVKDGKGSIISTLFGTDDLNAQIDELLALSEQGEAWADFAIGQVVEMCSYLHETPETQLIEIFTETGRTIGSEQQMQMSQLLPVVIDASKRCKTLDGEQLKTLGKPLDWFEKAAEANQASAFVTTGYSLISRRLREEIEMAPDTTDEEYQSTSKNIRALAKTEFRTKMREHFVEGRVSPETLMSMSEHLNLFYEGVHPYKSKEAWMLLACDQGYEQGCSQDSKMMSLFCMFDKACQSGGDFQQGVVWKQGQYKYDEHRRTADELKEIFAAKDWDRLGF